MSGTWALAQARRGLHVVPMGDLREHALTSECWCGPTPDAEQPLLWTHNSMDRREHTIELGKLQ